MGQLEREVKKTKRRKNIQEILLKSISAAGLVSIALLAPNALQMLRFIDKGAARKKDPKYVVNESLGRLLGRGLIKLEKTSRGNFFRITKEGEKKLQSVLLKEFVPKKPRRWDGKWRIVTFDIPIKRLGLRNKLRASLSHVGFQRLQNSLWVYPYDCEDFVTLLKADFRIGRDVLYVIAEKIEGDARLRKQFGLV